MTSLLDQLKSELDEGVKQAQRTGRPGTTCSIDGCTFQRHYNSSRCYKHHKEHQREYQKNWDARQKAAKPRRIPRSDRQCAVTDCTNPVHAKDWCHSHYRTHAERKPCTTPACMGSHHARGLCYSCYQSARRSGQLEVIQPQGVLSPEERFRSYVDVTDTCHFWTGHQVNGRGHFTVDGESTPAHRVGYELEFGPIPTDGEDKPLPLDHGCRRGLCVRGTHLEPVTQLENSRRRGVAEGRESFGQRDGWLFLALSIWQREGADNFPMRVVRTVEQVAT